MCAYIMLYRASRGNKPYYVKYFGKMYFKRRLTFFAFYTVDYVPIEQPLTSGRRHIGYYTVRKR